MTCILAGNSLQKHERAFDKAVKYCATLLEADLSDLTQSNVKVEAVSTAVEWKSLNKDSDKLYFKSWASVNNL